jgi:hypothetical protein
VPAPRLPLATIAASCPRCASEAPSGHRNHGALDLLLQDDDVVVIGRLDDDDLSAVVGDRNEAAVAELGDIAPYPCGILCAPRKHRVDDDVLLLRHRQRGRIFGVLRIIHVRRRVADQEHDPPRIAARIPAQLVDGDIERLVDALRPVAAASRLQLEQIGVEILDVGGQVERPGDVVVADVAIGDEAHANLSIGIAVEDRGGDRPYLRLAPSIRPPIEPVVSSTNATSTAGFAAAADRPAVNETAASANASERKAANGFMVLLRCSVPWNRSSPRFGVP